MFGNGIDVDGNNNIVVKDVKDSTINIVQSESKEKALKGLYDVIIQESNTVDTYIIYVLNRGGISWYGVEGNQRMIYRNVEALNVFINQNRYYFSDEIYIIIQAFYNVATELRGALDDLVMAISTADDQDAITNVYDITYEQDIHCSVEFVRYMMDAFNKADKHPAYDAFTDVYKKHEVMKNDILRKIQGQRSVVL